MSRSLWKGLFFDSCFSRNLKNKNYFKVWSRRSSINSSLVNKIVYVYNGKSFEKLQITANMIGFKFGDFIFTKRRGRFIHSKEKKKKKLKK